MNAPTGARVDVGTWISQGWALYAAHWQTWVKMGAVLVAPMLVVVIAFAVGYVGIIASAVNAVPQYQYDAYGQLHMTSAPSFGPPLWAFIAFGIGGVAIIVCSIASMYLWIGMWKSAIRTARGGAPSLADFRGNGPLFGRVLVASLAVGFLTMLGAIFCYVPALIVQGLFLFTLPLVVDRNLAVGDAMRLSREAAQPQLVLFIVYAFVVGLLSSLGVYACYVGMVASIPLFFTCTAVAYRASFDAQPSVAAAAPLPGPG